MLGNGDKLTRRLAGGGRGWLAVGQACEPQGEVMTTLIRGLVTFIRRWFVGWRGQFASKSVGLADRLPRVLVGELLWAARCMWRPSG
jgi:hypothetical protein